MIKIRSHRKIALLLVLAMLATMFVGIGTASADEPIVFTNATANGLDRNTSVQLGWVKGTLDQATESGSTVYVTVQLPNDVEWATASQPTVAPVFYGASTATNVKVDDDTYTGKITAALAADSNIKVDFSAANNQVKIGDSADSNIKVTVTAKELDANGFTVWEKSGEFTVGTVGDAVVTATAKTAEVASYSVLENKTGSDIELSENVKGALTSGQTITLSLPDDYKWAMSTSPITGLYANQTLNYTSGNGTQDIVYTVANTNPTLADEITITPVFQAEPGAAESDVVVTISSTDGDLDTTDLTVLTWGEAAGTITVVDSSDLKTVRVGTATGATNDIKIKSDVAFNDNKTIELALPDGFEFAGAPSATGVDNVTLYSDNEKCYMQVNGAAITEVVISSINVKAKNTAPVGPLAITVSGTAGVAGTAEVANIKARAAATADAPTINIGGLNETAGNITITEADKNTLMSGEIVLKLPAGVKLAKAPKVSFNGGDADTFGVSAGATEFHYDYTNNASKADKIVFSNLVYDVDTRVASDVSVDIYGSALTNTGSTDAILSVVNAKAVEPNAVQNATINLSTGTITVSGTEVAPVAKPFAKNNRTYSAIRDVAHILGINDSNILWNQADQTVTLMKGDKVVQLKLGSKIMLINGIAVTMDVAVEAANGYTFLPAAWVAQAFGATATWDAATNTVTIK